jgi:ribosomal protein L19E
MKNGGVRSGAGRKPGSRNKRSEEVEEWARSVLEDSAVRKHMVAQLKQGTLPPQTVTMLFHYAYGKPVERIINTIDITFTQLVEQAPQLSDVELRTLLATVRSANEHAA